MADPTTIDLWQAGDVVAKRNRTVTAVDRGSMAALTDLRDRVSVTVLIDGGGRTSLTARPEVFPPHGAIPFLRDGVPGVVWTNRDDEGYFLVAEATADQRVARVLDTLLTEDAALQFALKHAGVS